MEKNKLTNESKDSILIVFAVIAIVFIITVLFVTYYVLNDLDPSDRGTYGDMYGGANALFSGLAFVGIIITILLQRKELSLQRQELKDTRYELARSARAQESSDTSLKRQAANLQISAELSALSSLLKYYTDEYQRLESSTMSKAGMDEARVKKLDYVNEIEKRLKMKTNSISYNSNYVR